MKTVGEILKEARKKKKLTLVQVSKRTRIQKKYLTFVEENRFDKLPAATFVKGFIQNYAKAVGANPQMVLAIFRRDFSQDARGRIIPRGLTEPIKTDSWFTPRTSGMLVVAVLVLLVLGFFGRQIYLFYAAPDLAVLVPEEQAVVQSPITVSGTTQEDVTVMVNNQAVSVGEGGAFTTQIQLSEGEHTIVVEAESRNGKTRVVQRFVRVE